MKRIALSLIFLGLLLFPLLASAQGSEKVIVETGITDKQAELLYTTYRSTLTQQRENENQMIFSEVDERMGEIGKGNSEFIKKYGDFEDNIVITPSNYEIINRIKKNNVSLYNYAGRYYLPNYKSITVDELKKVNSEDGLGSILNGPLIYSIYYDGYSNDESSGDRIGKGSRKNGDIGYKDYTHDFFDIYTEQLKEGFYLQKEYLIQIRQRKSFRKYEISSYFRKLIKDKIIKSATVAIKNKKENMTDSEAILFSIEQKIENLNKALQNFELSKNISGEEKVMIHGVLTDLIDIFYEFMITIKIIDDSASGFSDVMYIEEETGFVE